MEVYMSTVKGKRLLVLGGTTASLDVVKIAKQMGIYTIVTDDCPDRVAKKIADESAMVSTADLEGLLALIKEKNVDGVFCGPSEFNIRNVIRVTKMAGLPCYTDMETWDKCANKDAFKSYCREYGVDCTPEYDITSDTPSEELEKIKYPIIIKPVDACSSAGVTVCASASEVPSALEKAYAASKSKRIIAEKYIENGGEIFNVRYMLRDGEAYPYFMMDTYVVDPVHRTSLIDQVVYAPSKYAKYYMENMDMKVRRMLKGMGLKNGTAFIQSLPCEGKIFFHEMGYRLSGGLIFKLSAPLANVHDMQTMIRYAVGGESITPDEVEKIDLNFKGKVGCQLMIPLSLGVISRIEGMEEVKANPAVVDFLQYYGEGDEIGPKQIGTLGQHFCRITYIVDTKKESLDLIEEIQDKIKIYDQNGQKMNVQPFDIKRI